LLIGFNVGDVFFETQCITTIITNTTATNVGCFRYDANVVQLCDRWFRGVSFSAKSHGDGL